MRAALILPVLAAFAAAAPRPQGIDLAGVDAAPAPVFVTPAYDVLSQSATAAPTSSIQPITTDAVGLRKRRALMEKRDGNCAPQPPGSGPTPTPDTPDAFRTYQPLQVSDTSSSHYSKLIVMRIWPTMPLRPTDTSKYL